MARPGERIAVKAPECQPGCGCHGTFVEEEHELRRVVATRPEGGRRTVFYGTCSCGEPIPTSANPTSVERKHRSHVKRLAATAMAMLALAVPSVAGAALDAGFNGAPGALPARAEAAQGDPVVEAVSATAGRPVTISCDTAEELRSQVGWALAYVVLDGSSVIHAGPSVCGWLAHPESPTFGEGLMAVIHEAYHLRWNSVDESRVNCAALNAMPSVTATYFPALDARIVLWGANRFFEMTPDSYRQCEEA